MKAKSTLCGRPLRYATILALLLFIVAGQTTGIKAQKLPPLLDTGAGDPSAFNAEDIRKIKEDYDKKVSSSSAADKEAARQLRNRLIGIGREQVDAMFYSYLRNDRKKRRLVQFLLDVLEIGAATAISLVNGERAKTVISEGLGAIQAGRTSLNKNFQLLERQVIINKMEANRATALAGILDKREQDATQYPWEDARADLRVYRDAGTLDAALASLSSTVGKERFDAEENLREIKDKPLTSAATPADFTAVKAADAIQKELETALADEGQKAAALEKLQKIVEKLEADQEIAERLKDEDISKTTDDGTDILDALKKIKKDALKSNRRDLIKKINLVIVEVEAKS